MPSPSYRGPCSPPRCAARCCRSRYAARRGTPPALPPGFPCPRRVGRGGRVSCRSENEVSGQKTLVSTAVRSSTRSNVPEHDIEECDRGDVERGREEDRDIIVAPGHQDPPKNGR